MSNTKVSKAVSSVEVEIFINDEGGKMIKIGGQQGAKLDRQTTTVDVRTKEDKGKSRYIVIADEWRLTLDGFYKTNNVGLARLHDVFARQEALLVQMKIADDYILEGYGVLESYPQDAPNKGTLRYSVTIVGAGDLCKKAI